MSKTVGLALSGGALRGIFHLGVIKALEELAVEISVMCGTSSGAIVGVLYANGHTPEEILELTTSSSFLKMLDLRTWTGGLLSLRYLEKLLKNNLSVDLLEDLERPVLITATNLLTGEVEVFETGSIISKVIASSSIPIMFSPKEMNGQLFIDGGIGMNAVVSFPYPEPALCHQLSDLLIGVEAQAPQSGKVRRHVAFADEMHVDALRAQVIA